MNTQYIIIKELQNINQNLSVTVQKLDSDYNSLLQKYAKIVQENTQLRDIKRNCLQVLYDSKFKSNKLFAENIQSVIDKINESTETIIESKN